MCPDQLIVNGTDSLMFLDEIIQLSQGLLTPVIGLIAVYIAYQQHKVNRARERRESRQAKLVVYSKIKRYLTAVSSSGEITNSGYDEFGEAVAEADFLFPDDVTEWLDELYGAATKWIYNNEWLTSVAKSKELSIPAFIQIESEDHEGRELIDMTLSQMISCMEDHQNAHKELKKRFLKYMELD